MPPYEVLCTTCFCSFVCFTRRPLKIKVKAALSLAALPFKVTSLNQRCCFFLLIHVHSVSVRNIILSTCVSFLVSMKKLQGATSCEWGCRWMTIVLMWPWICFQCLHKMHWQHVLLSVLTWWHSGCYSRASVDRLIPGGEFQSTTDSSTGEKPSWCLSDGWS